MRKKILISIIFLVFLASSVPPIHAEDNFARKLGRGCANLFLGWLEIPKEVGDTLEDEGEVAACFAAPFTGLVKGLIRTVVGAYEIITFPIPIPGGYRPVLEPEFVLQKP